ncbi:MAG: MerR family transcriptional regulator [Methylacidiphilales bacterium]|nr:MerR family transcriptional regulator [Candidatus Methylacidiphilales bacterium]NJR17927.1 MerR family transcriptional regulator [Calothrix sp. CSU_2_0]
MDTELTIQQVASLTGLSVHTLRYYERNGLLKPVPRAANGHRRYTSVDIASIEFLTKLRMTGMSIRHMQKFAKLMQENPQGTISDRRKILESHESQVLQHLEELHRNLAVIQKKIQLYKELEITNRGAEKQ